MADEPEVNELPDNILDITQFEKIGDSIIDKRIRKTTKSTKKTKKSKDKTEVRIENNANMMDFEKDFFQLLEENEYLRFTVVEEQVKRKTVEKILNRVLKMLGSPKDLQSELKKDN